MPVIPPVVVPWQAPIMHAVADGIFSPGVGDALLRGLGTLDQSITAEKLAAALQLLLVEAPGMNTEQAYKRARRLRDELDAASILAREKQARDDTTWSLWRRADGVVTLHALLPPEQGELWIATYDALTSPRRGGVRFVDPDRAAWVQSVKDDPRTVDQIAADSFTQLLKLGADADPSTLFGGLRPVVQIIVAERDRPTTGTPAPTGTVGTADAPPATPAETTGATQTTKNTRAAKATSTTGPFGYFEGSPAPRSERDDRPTSVRRRLPRHPVQPGRPAPQRRTRRTPVQPGPTPSPRRPRRRMPLARLRSTTVLVGSASRRKLG